MAEVEAVLLLIYIGKEGECLLLVLYASIGGDDISCMNIDGIRCGVDADYLVQFAGYCEEIFLCLKGDFVVLGRLRGRGLRPQWYEDVPFRALAELEDDRDPRGLGREEFNAEHVEEGDETLPGHLVESRYDQLSDKRMDLRERRAGILILNLPFRRIYAVGGQYRRNV